MKSGDDLAVLGGRKVMDRFRWTSSTSNIMFLSKVSAICPPKNGPLLSPNFPQFMPLKMAVALCPPKTAGYFSSSSAICPPKTACYSANFFFAICSPKTTGYLLNFPAIYPRKMVRHSLSSSAIRPHETTCDSPKFCSILST